MLGKLIKYDFKAMSKIMFPIFGVMLAVTFLFSLMIRLHIESGLIFTIVALMYSLSISAAALGTIYCIVTRFRDSLLKNEGYLYFALPVKISTHIAAKVINAIIWSVLESLAMLLSAIIMGLVVGSIEEVARFFSELFKAFRLLDGEVIVGTLRILTIMTLELISVVCFVYATMAVGHLFKKHKKLAMFLFVIIISAIRLNIMPFLFRTDAQILSTALQFGLLPIYLVPIVTAAVYSLLTWFILDRHLDLE